MNTVKDFYKTSKVKCSQDIQTMVD